MSGAVTTMRDRHQVFQEEIEPHLAQLLRVAYSLTGSRADAEDLVQDTLIRAWRALDDFDGAYPRAWLLTILRRAHLNSRRRRRPDLTGEPVTLDGARPAFGAAPATDPAESVADHHLTEELERAVTALDDTFRVALLLVDVDQLTYAEAAAVLDVPVGTVYSRLSRARDRVRRALPARYLGYDGEATR